MPFRQSLHFPQMKRKDFGKKTFNATINTIYKNA